MANVTVYESGTDDTDTAVWNKVDLINNSDVDFGYVNVSPAFNIQMKDEITLLDINGTQTFGGYIRDINNQTLKETIVFGYDVLLSDIEIQKNFENFSPEGIIQFCVELAGLTYNSTIVSGLIIPLYPAKDKKLKTVISDMLSILGAVSRVHFDKNYYLSYSGEDLNGIVLETGQNCTLEKGWDSNTESLCTQVKVKGEIENIILEPVLLNGTGTETDFEVDNIFVSIKVEVDNGGGFVEQTPEISGVQAGDYIIQKELKKIIFQSGSIPSSGTGNIRITYTYDREITYTEASEIILPDKSNLHQKTIKEVYLKTIEDVEAYAGDYLNKFSKPLISGTIKYDTLNINNFKINQSIRCIDNTRKVDGNFVNKVLIIKRLRREFGAEGASLLIDVGESTDFSFNRGIEQENRLKQLEENITTAELLQFGIKTTDTITQQFDVDIGNIEKRTFDSDVLYWQTGLSNARTKWRVGGTGSLWKTAGYTTEDVDGLNIERVVEDGVEVRISEGGEIRITEASAEDTTNDGIVSGLYQNLAQTNVLTALESSITHFAVGDDNTIPTESDLTLTNETYRDTATVNNTGLKLSIKTILDILENNGNDVKENGGLDAASSGNLFFHDLTTVVPKDGNTEIRLTHDLLANTENTNL